MGGSVRDVEDTARVLWCRRRVGGGDAEAAGAEGSCREEAFGREDCFGYGNEVRGGRVSTAEDQGEGQAPRRVAEAEVCLADGAAEGGAAASEAGGDRRGAGG